MSRVPVSNVQVSVSVSAFMTVSVSVSSRNLSQVSVSVSEVTVSNTSVGHSTDQCTFLLKQTASYFVTHGSSVHAVFLEASKAFDQVLHMKLLEKLIQRKVPMCFVRLLKHWYT